MVVVHDQVGCPTYTGHLAIGLVRLIDSSAYGIHHMAGTGQLLVVRVREEIFRQAEVVTRVMAATTDMMERPAKRPANSVLGSGREAPISCPSGSADSPTTWSAAASPRPRRQAVRAAGSTVRRQPVFDLHPKRDEEGDESDAEAERRRSVAQPEDDGEDGGMKLLVAGGAGFIGSNYVRRRLDAAPGDSVRVLDKLTYAGRRENLEGLPEDRLELVEGDIADRDAARAAVEGCDAVVNFAAESHVDRSIESPGEFITHGRLRHLRAARGRARRGHPPPPGLDRRGLRRPRRGLGDRGSPLDPSSPYSASKAGGDLLVSAFARTYGAEALIVRASNNYGPRQHPEKLIPLCILNALAGDPLPVYGDGMQVRNWLYVEDCCAGDRRGARARRARRGLQRRRPRRAPEHRGRAAASSSSPAATSR